MSAAASARATKQSGTSFSAAFALLPRKKRDALYALYSFCRQADDCVDEDGGAGERGLAQWMEEVDACYAGRPRTRLGADLARALERFPMPRKSFFDIAEGCRMDLHQASYETMAELRVYCERVASAVGLAAIEIFGYRDPATRDYATELGVALQLTNILRDVTPDAERGRLYVPVEDLRAAGVAPEAFLDAALGRRARESRMNDVLRDQGARARRQFALAESRLPRIDRGSMRPAQVMAAVYREIFDRLESSGFPFGERARLSRWTKAWVAVRCLAREATR